jgi:hypothetical protein
MSYGFRIEMAGMTQGQYDGLHARIAAMAGDTPALLVHVAGPTDGGWYVTEVWTSKGDFDAFMAKMAPMFLSPDAPPMKLQEFTVYNCETQAPLPATS